MLDFSVVLKSPMMRFRNNWAENIFKNLLPLEGYLTFQ